MQCWNGTAIFGSSEEGRAERLWGGGNEPGTVWLWEGGEPAPGVKFHSSDLERAVTHFAKGTSVRQVWLWRRWSGGGARRCFAIGRHRQARQGPQHLCQPPWRPTAAQTRETSGSGLTDKFRPPWDVAASRRERKEQTEGWKASMVISLLLISLRHSSSLSHSEFMRRILAQSYPGHMHN